MCAMELPGGHGTIEQDRLTGPVGLPPRPVPREHIARQRLAERLERVEHPVGNRAELQERLNNLEPGHPSSPWDEHGAPRLPAPRLADLERFEPPLSDEAYAAHRDAVTGRLERAVEARLTTKDQFAIDKDGQAWIAQRRAVHDEIIKEACGAAADVPCDRKAIIAGGLGGA